jgi:hypothetical protein
MIDVFQIVSKKPSIYVSINPHFIEKIKFLIIKNYKSLRKFNREKIKINWSNFHYAFKNARYHLLSRLFKVAKTLKLKEKEILKNIKGFRVPGSHAKEHIILPRKINIIDFYLNVILPPETKISEDFVDRMMKELGIDGNRIKIKKDHYNKKVKYRICADNAILVDLILSLDKKIKKICLNNKKLAKAYIRGMMIGEGTAYFKKSRYVRIEMKNEKEIKHLHKLFRMLGFNCRPYLRSERKNMWSIYIGAKQLKKFYNEIGFGVHREKQKILEAAVNKKLRVNQYV